MASEQPKLEQPKKPQGAYWLYLAEHREHITKELGSAKGSVVAKAAGERWKALAPEKKAPYEKRAGELKIKYDEDLAAFQQEGGVVERKRKVDNSVVSKKDPAAPKKPTAGGYGQLLAEKRDEIKQSLPAGSRVTDVAKKAGEMWKALSAEARKPYEDAFVCKFAEYKKAIEEYRQSTGKDAEPEEEDNDEEDVCTGGSPKKLKVAHVEVAQIRPAVLGA